MKILNIFVDFDMSESLRVQNGIHFELMYTTEGGYISMKSIILERMYMLGTYCFGKFAFFWYFLHLEKCFVGKYFVRNVYMVKNVFFRILLV